jgi:predicted RNA binding protein YcfA (HicA-like mRNA interferase family)
MPPVPSVPATDVIRALEKLGFTVTRKRGSHHRLKHPDGRSTTVPVHSGRNLAKGTLRGILRDVELTVEDLDL